MRRGIFASFVWPVPLLLIGAGVILYVVLSGALRERNLNEAVAESTQLLNELRTFRTYYNENVVAQVMANGSMTPALCCSYGSRST